MATPAAIPDRIVTLQDLINFAASGQGTLEEVSRALSRPIDLEHFRKVVRRIDAVCAAKWSTDSRRRRAAFISAQNRRKGKLFEELVEIVLEACHAFRIYGRVQTLTNEIDWLVYLGPLSIVIPALAAWGTHFLCECKMNKGAFDGNWVTRLYAMTQTHGTKVAVLFTSNEVGNTGGGGRPQRAIQDYALIANPAFILRVSVAELINCVEQGETILVMLSNKYVGLRARRTKIGLLTN